LILDTSALLAVLLDEPEQDRFSAVIAGADMIRLSAASYVEAAIYLERNEGEILRAALDSLIRGARIQIEPVTAEQAMMARQAFVLFGKGRHKAALNFGDCFTYALAKAYGEPLLFKGGDFGLTDLEAAG
jgi:ribonuclease VapC